MIKGIKLPASISILIICLVLASLIVYAEDTIEIGLNSTQVIEPDKEPQLNPLRDEGVKFNEQEFRDKSDEDLMDTLGEDYFTTHFEYKEAKSIGPSVCLTYIYEYESDKVNMLICYNSIKKELPPDMSSILDFPQEISFSKEDALSEADELDLPFERNVKLVYDSAHNTLAWKVTWDHEPTQEERIQEVIEGHTFSVEDGEILRTHKFGFDPIMSKENKVESKITILQKIKNFFISLFKGLGV